MIYQTKQLNQLIYQIKEEFKKIFLKTVNLFKKFNIYNIESSSNTLFSYF